MTLAPDLMRMRLRRLEAAGFPVISRAIREWQLGLETDEQSLDLTIELVELVTKLEAP